MERWVEQHELARVTGMVIPAYFSDRPADATVRQLLWVTLSDCPHYLAWPNVWVVVDGDKRSERILREMQSRLLSDHGSTFNLVALAENHGKLWALRQGITGLLDANPSVDYVVIRDCDGDHAIADMPALLRAAVFLSQAQKDSRVIVVGSRRSRHRPMGWVRGELEALLDQVTLDSLAYCLAREERVLDLGHFTRQNGVPDLSSGYKVYGQQSALDLFVHHEPQRASLSEHDYWHYGPETVTIVEGLLQGTTVAEVGRLTWDGQPTTSFGDYRCVSLYGELLAWVWTRLRLPLAIGAQLYDNHAPGLSLGTMADGHDMLGALRDFALEKVRLFYGEPGPIPAPRPGPSFI